MAALPLGPLVTTLPSKAPQPNILVGTYVQLVPLAEEHVLPLFATVGQPHHYPLWTYMREGPDPYPEGFASFEKMTRAKIGLQPPDPMYWAIELLKPAFPLSARESAPEGHSVQGHVTWWRVDQPNGVIEIAHVMYGEYLRGKRAGTEVGQFL